MRDVPFTKRHARLAVAGATQVAQRAFRIERDFENAAVRYAHGERGFTSRKMNGLGFRGWPDRLFIWPKGNRMEWVEFKQPGEEPTPVQRKVHRMLRARGNVVHVVDNWVDFYVVIHG